MNVIRSFRNLDRHGQQRAPEVIEEEVRQLEPHLARFREDLVRLEVVASQTRGKKRIKVSLRLQLPSGVIAAREEGFEIEPALRKAFADLRVALEGTENRIAVARNRYIEAVKEYNVLARSFPTNLTGMIFGYKPKENFTVANEAAISNAPKVDFGVGPGPSPAASR